MAKDKEAVAVSDNEVSTVQVTPVHYQISETDRVSLLEQAGYEYPQTVQLASQNEIIALVNLAFNAGMKLNTTAINEMLTN